MKSLKAHCTGTPNAGAHRELARPTPKVADIFTKAKRSEVMARIHSRGNRATVLHLIALMREHGITGWRRNARVFGKPDFVFRTAKLAVFVDGCF